MKDSLKTISVSELNRYIATLMNYDDVLSDVTVSGEISNFKNHSSGHLYFSLKDDNAKVSCVMFRGNTFSLSFVPEDGMQVSLRGRVGVYEKTGNYQIYAQSMEKAGSGALYEKYIQLLEALKGRGYFDEEHKKSLPYLPERIALVTSPTGAAVRDMISVIKRRCPISDIIVCPVLVQGQGAGKDIAAMIDMLNEKDAADLIITGRGGGSIEELWAFNEPVLADSIYNSHIPVISAVGHETDFTIADFVSDRRAPTPSVAAEFAVPDVLDIISSLRLYKATINEAVMYKIKRYRENIKAIKSKAAFMRPMSMLENKIVALDNIREKINDRMNHRLALSRSNLDSLDSLLKSLSYDDILRRGYFAVKKGEEFIGKAKILPSDEITLFGDKLELKATVTQVKEIDKNA